LNTGLGKMKKDKERVEGAEKGRGETGAAQLLAFITTL